MGKIKILVGPSIKFPETSQALEDPNGLLAAGGLYAKKHYSTPIKKGYFHGSKTIRRYYGGLPTQDAY